MSCAPDDNPQDIILEPDDLPNEDLISLAPDGYKPRAPQLRFVKRYIIKGGSKAACARALGIPEHRPRQWFNRALAARWLELCQIYAAGRLGVPKGWRAMADKAARGDTKAMHMLALRFDSTYRAAVNRQPVDGGPSIPDKAIESAKRAQMQEGSTQGQADSRADDSKAIEVAARAQHARTPGEGGTGGPLIHIGPTESQEPSAGGRR